jgi:hypothetical protein
LRRIRAIEIRVAEEADAAPSMLSMTKAAWVEPGRLPAASNITRPFDMPR